MSNQSSKAATDRRFVVSLLLVLTMLWLLLVVVLTKNSRTSHRRAPIRRKVQHHKHEQPPTALSRAQTQTVDAFSNLMVNRSKRVYDICNTQLDPYFDSVPADSFILDRQKGMLYCAVPATKSVMPLSLLFSAPLRQHRPKLESDDGAAEPDFLADALLQDTDYLENYPVRLLVVRNPADRLVNFYRDHLEGTVSSRLYATLGRPIVQQHRDVAPYLAPEQVANALRRVDEDVERERTLGNPFANPPGPTFTEFVQYVLAHPSGVAHWAPYHDYCFPCGVRYNFIIRYENIEEEGNLLHMLLTSKNEKKIPFSNDIDAPSSLDELCSYFSQLDSILFDQLVSMLTPDFILFNYSIDEILQCADEYVRQ